MTSDPLGTVGRPARQLWHLLTSGLSTDEFDRFVREEIPGAYTFYRRLLQESPEPQGRVRRILRVSWYLFLAFLERLTPVRRLLFAVSVLLFLLSVLQNIPEYGTYAFLGIVLLLVLEVADKLVTKNELVIAREIQLGLLPSEPAVPVGYDVVAYTEVANSVGGDYYDTILRQDGSVLYVLGDVSGKGISAALYTATVQTALRLYAEQTGDPRELVRLLDGYLRGQLRRSYFLTLLIARLDPQGSVTVCRAGHPGALHLAAATRDVRPIRPAGAAIGMGAKGGDASDRTLMNALAEEQVQLSPGDVLMLLSDGLLEAVDRVGQEYGEGRLASLLRTFPERTPGALRDRILGDVRDFRQGAGLRDDITFVLIRRDEQTS